MESTVRGQDVFQDPSGPRPVHRRSEADINVSLDDSVPTQALTDGEINRSRIVSSQNIHDLRGPSAWALTEATATTSEIPCLVLADINIDGGRVRLTGGSRDLAR